MRVSASIALLVVASFSFASAEAPPPDPRIGLIYAGADIWVSPDFWETCEGDGIVYPLEAEPGREHLRSTLDATHSLMMQCMSIGGNQVFDGRAAPQSLAAPY